MNTRVIHASTDDLRRGHPLWGILLISVMATLIISAPYLLSEIWWQGFSPSVTSDRDELYYIPLARLVAEGLTYADLFNSESETHTFLYNLTHNRPDTFLLYYIVGKFAQTFSLSNAELGLLLDGIIAPLGFTFSILFFQTIFQSRWAGILAGISAVGIPFTFYIAGALQITPLEGFFDLRNINHSAPPILEGIGTQASILLATFSAYLISNALINNSRPKLFLSGMVLGCVIFCYYQTWMIYAAVMSLFVAGHQLIMQNWRSSVICAITFGAGLLLTSATGLYFAYFSLNVGHRFSVESALYSQATYLCLEELLLAIMAACVVFSGIPSSLRSAALLLAALLCTSHIIGNLDVIFGRYLAGLQARPLFIQPLVIALLVGAVAESVTLFSHHSVRKSFGIFLTLLICIGPIIRSGTLSLGVLQEKGDKAALFQHIASSTNNNSVIALLPYDLSQEVPTLLHNHSDLPNELFFITGRRMISDYMGIQNVATPHIIAEREMLLGLIYTDRPALVRDCITPLSRYQKVDSYQYWLFHWLQLQDICHEEVSLQKNVTPCEFVGKYHFEYIIRDPQSPRNTSSFIAKYGQREWKSDSGAYSLLHYSSHRAISDFCSK